MEGFLVIDAGSGSVKTFFVSPEGQILRSSESLWYRETWTAEKAKPVILETIRNLRLDSSNVIVHGVSVTSMREEFVLLDRNGGQVQYELGSDSRKHGEKTLSIYGKTMYGKSGHWPVPNWIAGAILPWIVSENKHVGSMLMISDWVNHLLCGIECSEGSSACETALYDISNNNWDWKMIDTLNLSKSIFPDIKRNGEHIGNITDNISSLTDLPRKTPVILGGADTQCGLLGMGTDKNEVAAVGGTTTPVQLVLDKPVIDQIGRTWSNNHLNHGEWIIESNSGYTGRGVRWARENLEFKDYDELNYEASIEPIGSNGLKSYIGAHRFNAAPPYWENDMLSDINIKQGMYGKDNHNRGEQARSIIESNAYAVKANLLQLEEISGNSFSSLKFCGGNSKSALWMQIQADVLDMPVLIPEVYDGTAIGTAILASVGSNYNSTIDKAVKSMVRIKSRVNPISSNVENYENQYFQWMEMRKSMSLS